MMGRMTLREVREALARARSGEARPPSAPTVVELEELAQRLNGPGGVGPGGPAPPDASAGAPSAETPPSGRA